MALRIASRTRLRESCGVRAIARHRFETDSQPVRGDCMCMTRLYDSTILLPSYSTIINKSAVVYTASKRFTIFMALAAWAGTTNSSQFSNVKGEPGSWGRVGDNAEVRRCCGHREADRRGQRGEHGRETHRRCQRRASAGEQPEQFPDEPNLTPTSLPQFRAIASTFPEENQFKASA
jgi:hypothetical protein